MAAGKPLKTSWDINANIRKAVREMETRANTACVALFTICQARDGGYLDALNDDFWEETFELVDAMRNH